MALTLSVPGAGSNDTSGVSFPERSKTSPWLLARAPEETRGAYKLAPHG
jgi:hypothetical protein